MAEFSVEQFVKNLSAEQRRAALKTTESKPNSQTPKKGSTDTSSALSRVRQALKNIHKPNIEIPNVNAKKILIGATGLLAVAGLGLGGKAAVESVDELPSLSSIPSIGAAKSENKGPKVVQQDQLEQKTWVPRENSLSDDNGEIRLYPQEHLAGVINVAYKDKETNDWVHYNNIVPVAIVGGKVVNAEIAKAQITRKVITNRDGTKFVRYQYSKLPNGAHFALDVTLMPGEKGANIALVINDDSAQIDALALGNFLGMADHVSEVQNGGNTIYASAPNPPDGPFRMGRFEKFPLNPTQVVSFTGDDLNQSQQLQGAAGFLETEARSKAWMPGQAPKRPEPWIEAVQLFAQKPPKTGATWKFTMDYKTPHDAPQVKSR